MGVQKGSCGMINVLKKSAAMLCNTETIQRSSNWINDTLFGNDESQIKKSDVCPHEISGSLRCVQNSVSRIIFSFRQQRERKRKAAPRMGHKLARRRSCLLLERQHRSSELRKRSGKHDADRKLQCGDRVAEEYRAVLNDRISTCVPNCPFCFFRDRVYINISKKKESCVK